MKPSKAAIKHAHKRWGRYVTYANTYEESSQAINIMDALADAYDAGRRAGRKAATPKVSSAFGAIGVPPEGFDTSRSGIGRKRK